MPSMFNTKKQSTEETMIADQMASVPYIALSKQLPSSKLSDRECTYGRTIEISSTKIQSDQDRLPYTEFDTMPFNETVFRQLSRIVQSKTFIQSEKLCRFLRFIVEHMLDGNSDCLKEYLIGVEVYHRGPHYDPSQDSIVRTEARRLRSKLKVYYENEGKKDAIYIYLLPGSYIPAVRIKSELLDSQTRADEAISPLSNASIVTAILPFRDLSENSISSTYARGIPDELSYVLMRTGGCTVISPTSLEYFNAQEHNISATMVSVGARIAFEGSVRADGSHLRVTARIVDASGVQLWTKRIDTEVGTQNLFEIEEQIAFALSDGFVVVSSLSCVEALQARY